MGFAGAFRGIVENHMVNMENEMETGFMNGVIRATAHIMASYSMRKL